MTELSVCATLYCMKTEIYSWRLSPHLKSELQEAARAERKSVADLLEEIVKSWLRNTRGGTGTEEERQQRMREAVLKCAGTIEGSPDLAENARSAVRARIAKRHGY
jgi:hypothetical protein